MSIYTKSGDKGESALFDGTRVSKDDAIFEILGTLDELVATLGLASSTRIPTLKKQITSIQEILFTLGAQLANPRAPEQGYTKLKEFTLEIEKNIDTIDGSLPPLKNFILPNGTVVASYLHLARAQCRRLERNLVGYYSDKKNSLSELTPQNEKSENSTLVTITAGEETILQFTNRLSDYLFVLARYSNHEVGVKDIIWN